LILTVETVDIFGISRSWVCAAGILSTKTNTTKIGVENTKKSIQFCWNFLLSKCPKNVGGQRNAGINKADQAIDVLRETIEQAEKRETKELREKLREEYDSGLDSPPD